jgi:hypothetical protein
MGNRLKRSNDTTRNLKAGTDVVSPPTQRANEPRRKSPTRLASVISSTCGKHPYDSRASPKPTRSKIPPRHYRQTALFPPLPYHSGGSIVLAYGVTWWPSTPIILASIAASSRAARIIRAAFLARRAVLYECVHAPQGGAVKEPLRRYGGPRRKTPKTITSAYGRKYIAINPIAPLPRSRPGGAKCQRPNSGCLGAYIAAS